MGVGMFIYNFFMVLFCDYVLLAQKSVKNYEN